MKVACLLDGGFEDAEFKQPYDAFQEKGHEVTIIGLQRGRPIAGKKGEVEVATEKGIGEATASEFEALFIPGGYSPDHLRANPEVVKFTREFFLQERPVLAICHGAQLLMTAGVVEGRRLTAWKTIQEDLRHFGSEVVDEEVVVDRQLVTSRQPSDIPAFIQKSLAVLESVPARSPA